jgi:tripartite-type tricarboxylate transporter receptor subunit TctC
MFQLGVQLTHVPYKGTAQAFNDLLAGTIDMMFTSTAHGTPLIRAGQIRALGVAGRGRLSTLPQIPTIAEQRAPGYVLFDWKAVAVPRGVAPEIVAFLNRTINDVLGEKRIRERFELEGSTVVGGTPDQMLEVVRTDIERWKTLARKTNLRLE